MDGDADRCNRLVCADIVIRPATEVHLDLLTSVDLEDEGTTHPIPGRGDFAQHRRHIQQMLASDAAAWVAEVEGEAAGIIMCRFRDLSREAPDAANLFLLDYVPRTTFPRDGRFTEVLQLWVSPTLRRQGIGSLLKRHLETRSRDRDITQIFTLTEKRNAHVIAMNLALGYRIVQEGPMWDDVVRVALVLAL